ncbi:MAG: S8 family serine peptidase [Atopobiaceae bacterium]|nr:S8 family serine peptidase [Atopobiaceae bacterium]
MASSNYSYDSIIKGYDFLIRAAESGVDIRAVNRSLGMTPATNANDAMVQAAGEAGIVTCIASGNDHADLDKGFADPSYLQPSPYVLRINASNPQDGRAPFSAYGKCITDLFAPGVSILSTMPHNQEGMSRYFVQADDAPIYVKTNYSKDLLGVSSNDSVIIGELSEGGIGVDGDGSSLKVPISTEAGAYAAVYVDVSVGDVGIGDVQDISVAFNIGENEARFACVGILLEDGEYADEYMPGIMDTSESGPNGWCFGRLHISDPAKVGQGFKHVEDAQGRDCVRLALMFRPYTTSYADEVTMDVDLFIDQIAFGAPGNSGYLPYGYMNGTSMATPTVTGSAAIVSSAIETNDLAERAATTVSMVKSAVRHADGYRGLCKQNGQLDLSLLGSEAPLAPLIESAQVKGNTLVIGGANFSSKGSVLVADKRAEVVSWSDGSITVGWPDGLTSGLIPLVVKTDGEAEACRAFLLEAPQSISAGVALYERDQMPPNLYADGTSTTAIPQGLAALEDGTLFALVEDSDDRAYTSTHALMRSDDHGASWNAVELRTDDGESVDLKNACIAAGDGKVFILGGTPANRPFGVNIRELYAYDVAKGALTHVASFDNNSDTSPISTNGSLCVVTGRLYFIVNDHVGDEYGSPTHMFVKRFSVDYQTFDQTLMLDHEYPPTGTLATPYVAAAGNSMYVFGIDKRLGSSEVPTSQLMGLERVDIASDGSLSSTDLAVDFSCFADGLTEDDVCMAASEEGVFLVGSGLDAFLPTGAERTDTFFLKSGATSFEPYEKTLSYGPFTSPVAVCTDGWLYAFGISNYEDTTIFGRATKVSKNVAPEPEPEPEPVPEPDGPSTPDKSDTPSDDKRKAPAALPRTGDDFAGNAVVLALSLLVSAASIASGLRLRSGKAALPNAHDSEKRTW